MFHLQTDRSLFVTILVSFIVAFGLIFIVLSVKQLNDNSSFTDSSSEVIAQPVQLGFFCQDTLVNGLASFDEDVNVIPRMEAQVSVGDQDNYSVGDTIPFSVTVSNPYAYDITGAELLLAIVYAPLDSVVDYVSYPELLTIPAQDSITVDVPMNVPATVTSGGHIAVAHVGQSNQEILLSNALVGAEGQGSTPLTLYGNDPGVGETIRIMNGGGILVAGESVPNEVVRKVPSDSEEATVRLTIQNTFEAPVSGTLTWKVYGGLTPHPALLIDSSTEELSFNPTDSSLIKTLDLDLEYNQYSVVAELQYENSRQLVFVPVEKEGTSISNAIPPFLQLTHFGLNDSGSVVGCVGTRNTLAGDAEVVSNHVPSPFEVELAFFADEQTMINGGAPIYVVKGEETSTDLNKDDLGFSVATNHSQSQYYIETTVRQFGGEVSNDQFTLSCTGSGCQQ